jgi:glucose-1-phosphate thymidylyltransferase
MLAGIREIAIITTPEDKNQFVRLLGDGSQFGIRLEYLLQEKPRGIAEAFLIAENFIRSESVALILGDNIFNGARLGRNLSNFQNITGAQIFGYRVKNPESFGVAKLDSNGEILEIVEKPVNSSSDLAIPGLYFYDQTVVHRAKSISPSSRNELEITAINNSYLQDGELQLEILPRGTVWLDGGTPESLHDAASYVKVIEERQGQKLCCIDEIAWRNKWITTEGLLNNRKAFGSSPYGSYLDTILSEAQ